MGLCGDGRMLTVAIIPCTNQKSNIPGRARDVWSGAHFQLTLAHAERYYDKIMVLSYKYGLIDPDFEIEPYDINIKDSSIKDKLEWWWQLRPQIQELCNTKPDLISIYTGSYERDRIIKEFVNNGIENLTIPWKGLGIGERMSIVYDDIPPFTEEEFKAGKYKFVLEEPKQKQTTKRPAINVNEIEWVACDLEEG